jgi:nucleoside-diphosphate-sugar epimerase
LKNVLVIGHTGYLGSYITDVIDPIITDLRFESSYIDWSLLKASNPQIDTVIITARACSKTSPRRTADTMGLEIRGLTNILSTFRDCHIIYTSSKAVYSIDNKQNKPISRRTITDYIINSINRTRINNTIVLPVHEPDLIFDKDLTEEYNIYANTKKCAEILIKRFAHTYTILRIWDII